MPNFVKLRLNANSDKTKDYVVRKLRCCYERPYNAMTPNASPRCKGVEVTVDAPDKSDLFLTDWYISNRALSGLLAVYNETANNEKKSEESRVIASFENACCYYYEEEYITEKYRRITLHFDAEVVTSNEVTFTHL